jgi:hypothetical protein
VAAAPGRDVAAECLPSPSKIEGRVYTPAPALDASLQANRCIQIRNRSMRQYKVWISTVILLVIALHVVPVVHAGLRKRIWPILDWAMYKDASPPGPIETDRKRIVGITASGHREVVSKDVVGLSSFALDRLYAKPMKRGDSSAAQQLILRLNRQREDPFVEVRLEVETFTATDTGIVRRANPPITYRVDPAPSR